MRILTAILMVAAACFWTAPAWANRVALVIGNASYDHAPSLRNPLNDAADMAAALERVGFDVTVERNLDKTEMEKALQDFSRDAVGAETAVVFFAGHGIGVGGQSWLLPVSADLEREGDEAFQAIPLDFALRAVEGASGLRLVILDACRDNPFAASMAPRADGTRSVTRGLTRVEPRGDTLVWYAAKDGFVAADGRGRNSPFTGALLEYVETPGLELGTMFRRVVSKVRADTNRAQEPTQYGSRGSADFFFNGTTRPDQTAAQEPAAQQQQQQQQQQQTSAGLNPREREAFEAYELAKRVGSVSALRQVADRYPDTIAGAAAASDVAARDASQQASQQAAAAAAAQQAAAAQAAANAAAAQEREWRALARGDDVVGVVDFLDRYPNGTYAREARRKLVSLYREGQTELRRLGLYRFGIDGDWGRGSRSALQSFQRNNGLRPADGVLTGPLLAALRAAPTPQRQSGPPAGDSFRDCAECPEMVVIPSGSFRMGSPNSEPGRDADEGPQRTVRVPQFAAGKFEVTFAEWDACVSAGGCSRANDQGWGRGSRPVINVSWNEAQQYVRWLSRRTGHEYRLMTEAEWEYAARGGTTTPYTTGQVISPSQANYDGNTSHNGSPYGQYRARTTPVGSFAPNRFGLHDVHGNVREWVLDCYQTSFSGGPTNGSAWRTGDCSLITMRGSSWTSQAKHVRIANRDKTSPTARFDWLGLRVARTLR